MLPCPGAASDGGSSAAVGALLLQSGAQLLHCAVALLESCTLPANSHTQQTIAGTNDTFLQKSNCSIIYIQFRQGRKQSSGDRW